MRFSPFVLSLALVPSQVYANGCQTLKNTLSDSVFAKDSVIYAYESQNFWSNTEILSPECVFRPQSGKQLSTGLQELVKTQSQFAVRGGGHMGIKVYILYILALIPPIYGAGLLIE